MDRSLSVAVGLAAFATAFAALSFPVFIAAQSSAPTVRRVQILPGKGAVEIEIEGSDRLLPQVQTLTGPDRLVVDFPNAIPGSQLRNQAVNRGDVKSVRVALLSAKPPVTRVVLDLTSAQSCQVFPYGRTVMVKVGGDTDSNAGDSSRQPGLVNTSFPSSQQRVSTPPPASRPPLRVSFEDGLLSISSDKASLSEILFAVHERTGADIAIPAGAEQEKVAAELGPAPAAEILAHLLNGSRFNFLILSAEGDPRTIDRVILTPRAEGGMGSPLAQIPNRQQPVQAQPDDADNSQPEPPPAEAVQQAPPPGRQVPSSPPDTKIPENNDPPD